MVLKGAGWAKEEEKVHHQVILLIQVSQVTPNSKLSAHPLRWAPTHYPLTGSSP